MCGEYEMGAEATGQLTMYINGEAVNIINATGLQEVLSASVIFRHGFCSVLMIERYGTYRDFICSY